MCIGPIGICWTIETKPNQTRYEIYEMYDLARLTTGFFSLPAKHYMHTYVYVSTSLSRYSFKSFMLFASRTHTLSNLHVFFFFFPIHECLKAHNIHNFIFIYCFCCFLLLHSSGVCVYIYLCLPQTLMLTKLDAKWRELRCVLCSLYVAATCPILFFSFLIFSCARNIFLYCRCVYTRGLWIFSEYEWFSLCVLPFIFVNVHWIKKYGILHVCVCREKSRTQIMFTAASTATITTMLLLLLMLLLLIFEIEIEKDTRQCVESTQQEKEWASKWTS